MSQWLFFWHNAASVHGHGRFFIASPDAPPGMSGYLVLQAGS